MSYFFRKSFVPKYMAGLLVISSVPLTKFLRRSNLRRKVFFVLWFESPVYHSGRSSSGKNCLLLQQPCEGPGHHGEICDCGKNYGL